jgi:hypothetical protein
VEEARMMGEQEEKGQHVQDMSCRVAGGVAKGHIDHRRVWKKRGSQEISGVEQKTLKVSLIKKGGQKVV